MERTSVGAAIGRPPHETRTFAYLNSFLVKREIEAPFASISPIIETYEYITPEEVFFF